MEYVKHKKTSLLSYIQIVIHLWSELGNCILLFRNTSSQQHVSKYEINTEIIILPLKITSRFTDRLCFIKRLESSIQNNLITAFKNSFDFDNTFHFFLNKNSSIINYSWQTWSTPSVNCIMLHNVGSRSATQWTMDRDMLVKQTLLLLSKL